MSLHEDDDHLSCKIGEHFKTELRLRLNVQDSVSERERGGGERGRERERERDRETERDRERERIFQSFSIHSTLLPKFLKRIREGSRGGSCKQLSSNKMAAGQV